MRDPVYLDYNASAPLKPEARDAAISAMDLHGNPSSVHGAGRKVRRVIETARGALAARLGAAPEAVVFTSGATEANNLVLRGFTEEGEACRVLVNATEHDSVLDARADIEIIPVRPDGVIDIPRLQRMLADRDWRPTLISVMAVNNETGVINPVAEVAELAHASGAKLHVDAVQGVGLAETDIDVTRVGIDFLTVSGHKLGALRGVGAVLLGRGLHLHALNRGGGQEKGMRSGTENVAGIASFGAVMAALPDYAERYAALGGWRDKVCEALCARHPEVIVAGADAPRAPHVVTLILPGVPSETQVMALDLDGIAVSAGAACSSGKVRASHVLSAMGYDAAHAGSGVRVSFGWNSCEADADRFIAAYDRMASRLKARAGSTAA